MEGDHNSQRQVNAHILILVLNLTATPTQTQHWPVFARGRGFLDEIYGTYHFSKNFFKYSQALETHNLALRALNRHQAQKWLYHPSTPAKTQTDTNTVHGRALGNP